MVNGVRLFAGEDKAEAVGGVRRLGVEPSALLSDASLARMRLAHTAVHCLRKLVEAMNRLGVVWAAQESSASALDTLRGAQSLFREERALLKPSPESGPRSDDSDSDSSAGDRAELEQQHTMTLFYMAQVYGAMRRPGLSARCCHLTLARQCGEDATLSRKEWIEAAFGLAKYYASNRRFAAAAECLAACDAVAKKQPVPKAGTDDRKRDAELEVGGRSCLPLCPICAPLSHHPLLACGRLTAACERAPGVGGAVLHPAEGGPGADHAAGCRGP